MGSLRNTSQLYCHFQSLCRETNKQLMRVLTVMCGAYVTNNRFFFIKFHYSTKSHLIMCELVFATRDLVVCFFFQVWRRYFVPTGSRSKVCPVRHVSYRTCFSLLLIGHHLNDAYLFFLFVCLQIQKMTISSTVVLFSRTRLKVAAPWQIRNTLRNQRICKLTKT